MKLYRIILFIFLFVNCTNKISENNPKFTQEEIVALNLDSTINLHIQTDSIIKIDLNSFLEQSKLRFGEMIKSISFIPLETTDKSLISEIKEILITDSNIYIIDSYQGGSVLIFDIEGRYLKHIQRGQGPEELLNLKGIAFDENKQELIVYHYKSFSFFTPEGKFIRKEKVPFNASYFAIIPDGYLFRVLNNLDNRHMEYSVENQVFITDKQFQIKSVGLPYQYSNDNIYEGEHYINTHDNRVNFTLKFTDTIYQYIDKNLVSAKYVIDFSDKAISDNLLMGSLENFEAGITRNNYYYFLGDYVENTTHDYFKLRNRYIGLHTFFFRDKQSGNIKAGTELEYDPRMLPFINSPIASKGSYFITYHFPNKSSIELENKIISEEDKRKLKLVQDEDNPIIIFYELKDF